MRIQTDPVDDARLQVPNDFNFSRFLDNVIELQQSLGMITGMIDESRDQLMELLPEFGCHLGYDGKAIASHSTGCVGRHSGRTSDPDANWGKHETGGVDKRTGKAWTKVKRWFGYNLHVIADTQYEIPVAIKLTQASASEQVTLRQMIPQLMQNSPRIAERCRDFSADRGLDCSETKALLWDDYQARPLIDTRLLWRHEKKAPDYDPAKPITRPLYPQRVDTVIGVPKLH